uniref:Knottin scorpion toxin-like domain-containing protein n=1 Tax=Oryza punctata TaxID=4537 RepID=A0A0E0MHM7_ORYPU
MAAKFSSVIFGVLIFVAIAATLFSTGLARPPPPGYEFCFLKCIDDCDQTCKNSDYTHGGDCNTGPCCCLW